MVKETYSKTEVITNMSDNISKTKKERKSLKHLLKEALVNSIKENKKTYELLAQD